MTIYPAKIMIVALINFFLYVISAVKNLCSSPTVK